MSRLLPLAFSFSHFRGGLRLGSLERAAGLGQRTISPLSGELLFFACAPEVGASRRRKSNQKKAHPESGAPTGFPAMLGAGGTSPNSSPYRLLEQSATSIPPDSCASRRLPRGPTSKAGVWLVVCADIASRVLHPFFPSPLAGEGSGERGAARSAVPLMYRPLEGAEKRSAPGVWKWPTVRGAYRATSSATSPGARASQGTPRSGAPDRGVLSLVTFFAQAKKVTRPTGRNSARTQATQRDQAIPAFIVFATSSKPTAKSSLSRVWLNRTDIESVRPLGQTLPHEGGGDWPRQDSRSALHG